MINLMTWLGSCSGLKYVPENDKLFTGSKVTLNAAQKPQNEALVQTELESVIRPKPNGSFLGMRPKLYFWHIGEGKKRGLGKFIADRFGEAPVLLSQVKISATEGLIRNRLQNHGYFQNQVAHEVKQAARTAEVNYTATADKPYTIRKIVWPAGDSLLNAAISSVQGPTLLKVGDDYNLQTLTAERFRVDAALKNRGYYFFAPDAILFDVDSTLDNQVDVFITVKGEAPARARIPYALKQIDLNSNYVLTDTTTRPPVIVGKYHYFPDEKVFKAKAILQATFLYPDSLYSRRRRDQTISRLMSLGTFKFVEIRFHPSTRADSVPTPGTHQGNLDVDVLMTQLPKNSLRAEIELLSKSNGFTGPGFRAEFRNRSTFKRAENLLVNLTGTFENQTRQATDKSPIGLTSYELGINTQLLVPRLITPPFDIRLVNSDFQPRTSFGAGYRFVERREAFRMDVINLNYGYSWKTKLTNEQELRPIDVQRNQLSSTSAAFDKLLRDRPFLQNSFRQQFILGSSYRYTYNQQVLEQRRQQIFFGGGLEVSGNLASVVAKGLGERDAAGNLTIGGQEFSQYAKLDLELREYYRISADPARGNRVAARLLIGLGMPYGNSRVLPYLRQYGVGGPYSIRAFPARGIGPGSYRNPNENISFYDQVGDIRLEGNVEYRQDIVPYVKGALFVDAGNIWLVNDDPTRPGGQFKANTFLQQLAIGYGAGLRIDVQFFVIRFDYALPLRAGYGTPTGDDKAGRLNLAIGYPF